MQASHNVGGETFSPFGQRHARLACGAAAADPRPNALRVAHQHRAQGHAYTRWHSACRVRRFRRLGDAPALGVDRRACACCRQRQRQRQQDQSKERAASPSSRHGGAGGVRAFARGAECHKRAALLLFIIIYFISPRSESELVSTACQSIGFPLWFWFTPAVVSLHSDLAVPIGLVWLHQLPLRRIVNAIGPILKPYVEGALEVIFASTAEA